VAVFVNPITHIFNAYIVLNLSTLQNMKQVNNKTLVRSMRSSKNLRTYYAPAFELISYWNIMIMKILPII
jgi:hypothetical protein